MTQLVTKAERPLPKNGARGVLSFDPYDFCCRNVHDVFLFAIKFQI